MIKREHPWDWKGIFLDALINLQNIQWFTGLNKKRERCSSWYKTHNQGDKWTASPSPRHAVNCAIQGQINQSRLPLNNVVSRPGGFLEYVKDYYSVVVNTLQINDGGLTLKQGRKELSDNPQAISLAHLVLVLGPPPPPLNSRWLVADNN